jgi:hypothetical protein
MALPYRTARAIVGIVKESTPYTFLEPAAVDSFHAVNIGFSPSAQLYERKDTRAHFGLLDALPGSAEADITFEIPLVGAAAGVAAFWDAAMLACGHSRTVATTTSVTYKPTTIFDGTTSGTTPNIITQPGEVYSVAIWEEGNGPRYAISGAQGNFSLSSKQGEPLIGKFKFHGAYVTVADDATPPAVTDSIVVPPVCLGATMSVHAVSTLAFDGFDFDKGNVLSKRGDISQASGVRGAWITAHKPMIKISPEMVSVATLDFYLKWRQGTAGAFTTGTIGTTAGNRFNFTAPRTQFRDLGLADREGARVADLGLACTTLGTDVSGLDYNLLIT